MLQSNHQPPMRISSLHDDLLWPKVAHECGLGEFRADGSGRAPLAERSPLCRVAQFGAIPEKLDHALLGGRGEGYDHYGTLIGDALRDQYETVVAAIFDRYTLPTTPGPDGVTPPTDAEVARSVRESAACHAHLGLPLARQSADFGRAGVNVVLAIEGMDRIRSFAAIDDLLAHGVRVFGLQYNRANALAGVATGLTRFGRKAVIHLWEVGAVVDLAHAPPATRRDVLNRAEAAGMGRRVCYSHGSLLPDAVPESAARVPNRFLAPDEARRLLRLGGILGLTPTRPFFPSLAAVAARLDALAQENGGPAGLALGTDFGGIYDAMLLPEIACAADLPRLGDVLRDRHDWGDGAIDRVLRTNATEWLRGALL